MDPYVYAIIVIMLIFAWCYWKVASMKKAFEDQKGSYEPLKSFLPEELRKIK